MTALRTVLMEEGAIDPASLSRKVTLVEQAWTEFDDAHKAYFTKLNPKDDQLEAETKYWSTEDAATEDIIYKSLKRGLPSKSFYKEIDQNPNEFTLSSWEIKEMEHLIVEEAATEEFLG